MYIVQPVYIIYHARWGPTISSSLSRFTERLSFQQLGITGKTDTWNKYLPFCKEQKPFVMLGWMLQNKSLAAHQHTQKH